MRNSSGVLCLQALNHAVCKDLKPDNVDTLVWEYGGDTRAWRRHQSDSIAPAKPQCKGDLAKAGLRGRL